MRKTIKSEVRLGLIVFLTTIANGTSDKKKLGNKVALNLILQLLCSLLVLVKWADLEINYVT